MRSLLRFLARRLWRALGRRYRFVSRVMVILGVARFLRDRPSSRTRVRVRPGETLVVGFEDGVHRG
ncbi:MAG: hypothetical protein ACO36A_01850 [Ilumatobacteraceae bacterium]